VDKESNVYTVTYAAIMTVVVAVSLAFVATSLQPKQYANQQLSTKMDILKAVGLEDLEKEEAARIYDERIEGLVLGYDMNPVADTVNAVDIDLAKETKKKPEEQRYPLFVYRDGATTRYIVPLYGNGLWDKIWGYVAIEEDFNTIAGISMDHKAETPGLGAEIKDNPDDYNQPFVGKKLYDENGEYVSVAMKKGAITDPAHQVDAITGATITSDGVSDMLYEDVKAYLPYFQTLKNS
jgi:Na+-transporting NADH:ubiquinone oxidoreductase subunit C